MSASPADRLAVFVDGRNLWHGCDEVGVNCYVDLWKLARFIEPNSQIVRINYFDCPLNQPKNPAGYADQQRFINYLLNRADAVVQLGHIGYRHGAPIHKQVDTKLTTDLIIGAFQNAYDVALVVSGDADFSYPMEQVRSLGK